LIHLPVKSKSSLRPILAKMANFITQDLSQQMAQMDIGMQSENPGYIKRVYAAEWFGECWYCRARNTFPWALNIYTFGVCFDMLGCNNNRRHYFHVLENAYEDSFSINSCCFNVDFIQKFHFDRGVYEQKSCCWDIGCFNGAPAPHANQIKYVCCCQDCPDIYNDCLACYFPSICGDRVRFMPFEFYCFCCPNRATCFSNCFGCYGPKTGEPLVLFYFVDCLRPGSGAELVQALDTSRAAWRARTGYN